jgi:ATP-dependent exoDNAse (exonuclease V) beta subunit
MPPTLSYSSLSELERCGYRFYLERVLGLPEDRAAAARALPGATAGLEARARGTLVHRLLEELDFARPVAPSPADVERVAGELGMRPGEAEREEIAALLEGALASQPAARVAAARRVRREHPFAFSLGEEQPLIAGVIDLLAEEAGGGFVVLDYKSDRVGPEVDLGALVERDYGIQRLLYALAVLREGAASVEVVHWFLARPRESVGARYAAAERGELEERLAARLRRARAEPFEVARHPHRGLCLTCPGRTGLCSWSEEATLREDTVV